MCESKATQLVKKLQDPKSARTHTPRANGLAGPAHLGGHGADVPERAHVGTRR